MPTAPPEQASPKQRRQLLAVCALIALLTAMRAVYAGVIELRTDEAYYWTWSKESVLSFLDHPPMIAWFIRFGTAIFGDTNFGVRFAGLLAMLVTQLLLADIVRRVTHDIRAVLLAVLMSEAAIYYGLLMAKVAPDVALIPFAVAMVWALVRLVESDDARWWLAAGVFAGLALLSKFTAVMLVPAVLAFMLIPDWRRRWLTSPYPWAAALIAVAVFSPVLIWNAQHDWASFRFQSVRAVATHELSLRTVGDFFGLQFFLVGPILLPVLLSAVTLTAWRGYPAARCDLHSAFNLRDRSVRLFPLEVADAAHRRHLADVPVADRLCRRRHQHRHAAAGRLAGVDDQVHCRMGQTRGRVGDRAGGGDLSLFRRQPLEFFRQGGPDRRRGGLRAGRKPRAGRNAEDRRDLDRDHGLPHLCDAALVSERPRAGGADQRARPLPRLPRSRHEFDQGPYRSLCRARAGPDQSGLGRDDGGSHAAGAGRTKLARDGDGYLCAGETHRLDPRSCAAAGFAAVSLARAGGERADPASNGLRSQFHKNKNPRKERHEMVYRSIGDGALACAPRRCRHRLPTTQITR